jgi:threonine/homoserine efflux transporter RhtA
MRKKNHRQVWIMYIVMKLVPFGNGNIRPIHISQGVLLLRYVQYRCILVAYFLVCVIRRPLRGTCSQRRTLQFFMCGRGVLNCKHSFYVNIERLFVYLVQRKISVLVIPS